MPKMKNFKVRPLKLILRHCEAFRYLKSSVLTLTISICLNWHAKCKGVAPLALRTQGDAPLSKRVTTTFLLPYRQALQKYFLIG